jgi:hypothetical protein
VVNQLIKIIDRIVWRENLRSPIAARTKTSLLRVKINNTGFVFLLTEREGSTGLVLLVLMASAG